MKTTLRIKQSSVPLSLLLVIIVCLTCEGYSLLTNVWLGLLIMAVFAVGFSYWDGIEIDFEGRRIREFWGFGPLLFGTWQAIHPDNEMELRSKGMGYTSTSRSIQTNTYLNGEFLLVLRLNNGKFTLIKRSKKREELEELEDKIRQRL